MTRKLRFWAFIGFLTGFMPWASAEENSEAAMGTPGAFSISITANEFREQFKRKKVDTGEFVYESEGFDGHWSFKEPGFAMMRSSTDQWDKADYDSLGLTFIILSADENDPAIVNIEVRTNSRVRDESYASADILLYEVSAKITSGSWDRYAKNGKDMELAVDESYSMVAPLLRSLLRARCHANSRGDSIMQGHCDKTNLRPSVLETSKIVLKVKKKNLIVSHEEPLSAQFVFGAASE